MGHVPTRERERKEKKPKPLLKLAQSGLPSGRLPLRSISLWAVPSPVTGPGGGGGASMKKGRGPALEEQDLPPP